MKLLILTIILNIALAAKCPNDQLCASCQNGECKMCYQSYLNFGKCEKPPTEITNCLRYQSPTVCDVCFHGYTTNNEGACVKIGITDCLYVVDGKCKLCKRGILVENGSCGEKKCSSDNCDFCSVDVNNKEFCDKCDSGYSLMSDNGLIKCVKESDNNKNCMLLGENDTCTLCNVNYYSSNGKCVKSEVMDVKMISDQGFIDKVGDKFKDLFGSYVHIFSLVSLATSLLMIFA